MNCHEVQSEIASADSLSTEMLVHAQECAACRQTLSEVQWQRKWLRERFAEVSADLFANAPSLSEVAETPRPPVPLPRLAWAAVLVLGAVVLGWWMWMGSPGNSSKSSVAERSAPRESAQSSTEGASERARSEPTSPEFESHGAVTGASRPGETEPALTLPGRVAAPQPSSEFATSQRNPDGSQPSPEPAESSPEVAASKPTPPGKIPLHSGVFKMEATAVAPGASGYLAAIIPDETSDQAPPVLVFRLTGLPPLSLFYIRATDAQGNPVLLASGTTDKKGSAVPVVQSNPTTVSGNPTPSAGTFSSATFGPLTVVDAAGNVMISSRPVGNQMNPSPTP